MKLLKNEITKQKIFLNRQAVKNHVTHATTYPITRNSLWHSPETTVLQQPTGY